MSDVNQLLQTTKELIAFRTTEDRPEALRACADYIELFFESSGLTVERFENEGIPSVIVTKGTKTPTVFLSGHFDVVPGSDDQFEPQVKGDKLYGRGALDMKSGDAVMMHLMRDIAETEHSIGLMLTGDEEIGGFNGVAKLVEKGYGAEVVIIPDGGEAVHKVVSKEKGILRATLVASGTNAHGSTPWNGENAISKLAQAITVVEQLFTPVDQHPDNHWVTTVNVGTIQGGEATNQVPDQASATLDIRFTEADDPNVLIKKIASVLPAGVQVNATVVASMLNIPLEHKMITPFVDALAAHGRTAEWTLDSGASDGRFFADKGVPVIISQPDGANLHAPGEWVSIPALELYYHVIKDYLDRISR